MYMKFIKIQDIQQEERWYFLLHPCASYAHFNRFINGAISSSSWLSVDSFGAGISRGIFR